MIRVDVARPGPCVSTPIFEIFGDPAMFISFSHIEKGLAKQIHTVYINREILHKIFDDI